MTDRRAARKERLIEERSVQILEAAATVFARKGYQRATMKEIADEAGVAPGTIYLYFKNKEDLLINIPRQIGEPLFSALSAVISEGGPQEMPDDEALLTHFVATGMRQVVQNIDIFKVLLSSIPTLDEAAMEAYLRRTPLYFAGVLEQFFRLRIEEGTFRDINTAIAARAFLGTMMVFLISQEILPGRRITPFDYDEVAREIVRLFLYGAVVRPEGEVATEMER
ncbi:MAG: TetR/AcrR family transcriptional regulator [Anaerolineae bacterium]